MPRPEDLNDPFEYRAPVSINLEDYKCAFSDFLRGKGITDEDEIQRELDAIGENDMVRIRDTFATTLSRSGIICCSSNPNSNRMWAYYASSHKGICIGYSPEYPPFGFAMSVIYEDPKVPLEMIKTWMSDVTQFCDHISRRKGNEWEFEQEYRVPVGPIPDEQTRLLPIAPEAIVEIRLGVKIQSEFKAKILRAVRSLPHKPKLIQMVCDYEKFFLTEQPLDPYSD